MCKKIWYNYTEKSDYNNKLSNKIIEGSNIKNEQNKYCNGRAWDTTKYRKYS